MAKKNVHGQCKLCLNYRKLSRSHYLGAVLHRETFIGDAPPVYMTPKIVKASPRQLWAHLLCEECDNNRLNKRGEKPFLALFNKANNEFRLLSLMNVAMPAVSGQSNLKLSDSGLLCPDVDGTLASSDVPYSGEAMGIDTEALAYYALSVVWKGSIHKWKTLAGQETTVGLGEYQEPIRRYLMGEADFPDGVHVKVTACTDFVSQGTFFAPSKTVGSLFPVYSFLVRGIWFFVTTTKQHPMLRESCCYRSSRKLIFKANCEQRLLHAYGHLHKTAAVSPELGRSASAHL